MGSKPVDALEEAFEDTKEILLPFSLARWTKIGLIAIMAGSTGLAMPNFPTSGLGSQGEVPSHQTSDTPSVTDYSSDIHMPEADITGAFTNQSFGMSTAAIVAASVTGIILIYIFLSSIFSFIYYQSLIERNINIKRNFKLNIKNGAQYFIFRFFASILTLGLIAGAAAAAFYNPLLIIPIVLLALPTMIIILSIMTLIHDFVLLEMLEQNKKLIPSIKTIYKLLKNEWDQALIYIVLKFVVNIGKGVLSLIGIITILLALIVPFSILGIIGFFIHPAVGGAVAALGFLTFIFAYIILVLGPLTTYVQFFAIEVYRYFRN